MTTAVRALHEHWLPLSDNAMVGVRAFDVFSSHPPLLGTWTSGSKIAGVQMNHPGPLEFDWLVGPVHLLGPGPGVAIGVSLLQAASIVGIAVFAGRRGGPALMAAAALGTAFLCWAMGSAVLLDPWPPHVTILPFLWYLMLVWSVAAGDRVALPWAAGVGSFVLQTHLSFALLVPLLGLWALIAMVIGDRLARQEEPPPSLPRRATSPAAWTAAGVLLLCWVQPLIEQAVHGRSGNLYRLATHSGVGTATGVRTGVRVVADVVALPWFWGRHAFRHSWLPQPLAIVGPQAARLPLLATSAVALVILALFVGLASVWLWRRGDRSTAAAPATALVALVVAVAAAAQSPLGAFGLSPHQFRWLWPLGTFVAIAVAAIVLAAVLIPVRASWLLPTATALAIGTIGVAAANIPASIDPVTPNAGDYAIPVVHALAPQLDSLKGGGPYLIDPLYVGFADPYSVALIAALQQRGIGFVTADPVLGRQFGGNRKIARPGDAAATLSLVLGADASTTPRGERLVARYDPPTGPTGAGNAAHPHVAVFVHTNKQPAGSPAKRDVP